MNKIEEILKECGHKSNLNINKAVALKAMKEFGKICFEAARDSYPKWGSWENTYETYEDFLKEIEDEEGN